VRQPPLAEIGQLSDDVVSDLLAAARQIEVPELVGRHVLLVHRRREMLLDCDRLHESKALPRTGESSVAVKAIWI